ncbi:hypothetical protein LTR84_009717 [Exophiala bonariae]|uniref:DUF1330 domain-containing protein n=1 Tax=Exophiala bonariae TaxID=1690606 RepID=A0AAV9NJ09_9EURO|nr:hypothetical protein LTR84_009717 [Exophiala bonariae]
MCRPNSAVDFMASHNLQTSQLALTSNIGMSPRTEGGLGDLHAASQLIPKNEPYVMLNMMNFKPEAQYDNDFEGSPSNPISGAEAYTIYRQAFGKRATELGVKNPAVLFLGKAHTNLIAGPQEGESWDFIVMVRFENFASFKMVLEDEGYIKLIQPHRLAAVREFRSFAVSEIH